jgi:hypothetical protein
MTDDELIERVRLGLGYLTAHGRLVQCDDIRELVARHAVARAEADRLRRAMRRAIASIQSRGDDIATGAEILRHALDATPAKEPGGIVEGLEALREAGGEAWDAIEDPDAYLAGESATDGPIATWYKSRGLKVPPDAGK